MECTAKQLPVSLQTILICFIILPFSFTSKEFYENDNSEMFFEGQSFLEHNVTQMSNSERFGTDCQTQLWFKPTKRQGIILAFASDHNGTWKGFGLKDGYLRSFVFNQSQSIILGKPITMVTMNKWLHLSVRIHNIIASYSLLGKRNNFTGTLNHKAKLEIIYVGGVPVVVRNAEQNFQNFMGYIKELFVVCKTNATDAALASSTIKMSSFRCQGTCNLSRTRETNRGKSSSISKHLSTSKISPPTTPSMNVMSKNPEIITAETTTQRSGFLNDSSEVDKIDIIKTNSKGSPPQDTAKVSGIAKIYKVTVILIIFLFAAVSLYVLGMIVKNKVQQYRAKLREERQVDMMGSNECLNGGAEDGDSFVSNRPSNLCDIETGTNINEQQTSRFWRERGERLLTVQGNQLRMSTSTQSLNSNFNDMESAKVKFWREGVKKGNQIRMSASTHSLSSRRSSAPVCESSLYITPRPSRKREGSSFKDIPRVVLTSAQDNKVIIKRDNPLRNIHGRATNTLINLNGKMPDKGIGQQIIDQEGLKREGKYKSCKNAHKIQGCALKPKENAPGKMSYKWAYIRPDSETECSENERMRQSGKTNRRFDTTFRPFSLRILETNESEEEENTYNNKKKSFDDFQTFRCRSSDNICRVGEPMKISYDPCLSSSQGERLVCFGIHSASSDPSVVSSSRANLMCDCAIQQRLHSSFQDTASVDTAWDSKQQLDASLDSFLYDKSCPADHLKDRNHTSQLQENGVHQSRLTQLDSKKSFFRPSNGPDVKAQQMLENSKEARVQKIPSPPPPPPPLPPSSLQLQQKKRQQLQLNQLPTILVPKEVKQQKNVIGQKGRLLRQPRIDLTQANPRPHSSCNFRHKYDDEDLCPPITMSHASSCDSIPRWVVTPASSKNSNESFDDSVCTQQNRVCSQKGLNKTKSQGCDKSCDIPVANINGFDNSAREVKVSNQQIAKETNNQALKNNLPESLRDVPVASSNGLKNPWILRPNVLSKKNEHGNQRKVLPTKYQANRWHPRQGVKPKSSLLVPANNKDGEGGEKKVWRRSSWASGNRPSEFELALKGTVPVKRPPTNTSVLLKVPGSRTRPQSETMF